MLYPLFATSSKLNLVGRQVVPAMSRGLVKLPGNSCSECYSPTGSGSVQSSAVQCSLGRLSIRVPNLTDIPKEHAIIRYSLLYYTVFCKNVKWFFGERKAKVEFNWVT